MGMKMEHILKRNGVYHPWNRRLRQEHLNIDATELDCQNEDEVGVKQKGLEHVSVMRTNANRRDCIRQGGMRVGRNAVSPKKKTCTDHGYLLHNEHLLNKHSKIVNICSMKEEASL